ncbi:hypothetical protein ACQ4PT_054144 [Festuca glaucescens]
MDMPTRRKPIVDTICQDVGGGFLMAGVFGSAYHFANGGIKAVYKNVPRASCSLAVFFGLYGAIDYAMVSARRKEEPVLNCAVAMAGASALTDLPKGLRYAGYSALIGGALGGVLTAGLKLLEDGSRPQVGDPGIPTPSACKSCGREDR